MASIYEMLTIRRWTNGGVSIGSNYIGTAPPANGALIEGNILTAGELRLSIEGKKIGRTVDNSYLQIAGGSVGGGTGAIVTIYGSAHATLPGVIDIGTSRADLAAAPVRIVISGAVDQGYGFVKIYEPLAIQDPIPAAPALIVGFAQLYVDPADGDLKVIFADGTVKLIVADT